MIPLTDASMNVALIKHNRTVMLGLHSPNNETFLRTYLSIPDDKVNDVPHDVWSLIVKRLRDMPNHEKSELLNKIHEEV